MPTLGPKQNQSKSPEFSRLARPDIKTTRLDHREHPLLRLQRTIGNQSSLRLLQTNAEELKAGLTGSASPRMGNDFSRIPAHAQAPISIQPKLEVSTPGDIHEQEADHISEQVMRMSEPKLQRACSCGGGCSGCQTEPASQQHQRLQTKHAGPGDLGHVDAPPIVKEVLSSSGQPLDAATRAFMEPRFGHDFSRVRVHSGAAADQSARDMHAHAYTVGQNIVLRAERYAPATNEGRRLLAHELTHVVQQRGTGPRLARSPDDKEAAAIGSGVEPLEVKEWETILKAQGYEVFTRKQFDRVDWLAKAFSDKRARPDLVAVSRAKRHVLVGDITAGPWSQTALKPGDLRKLPNDIGAERETKPHLEKTVDNARQAHEHLPEDLRGFSVTAQDRWWKEGGYSREITIAKGTPAPKPTGGAPLGSTSTSVGRGGPSAPAPAKSARDVTTRLTAEPGAPLEPVVEATPGFNPGRGAGIGGGFQLVQAMQFGNLQRAEVDKFQKRLAELQPKIDAYLSSDYSVELMLIVEKPNSRDFGCASGVFCDQSQFIYFHDLYIKSVESVKPLVRAPSDTTHATMSAGRGPVVPERHQGGPVFDINDRELDTWIRNLPTRDPLHHCEYAKLTLKPQQAILPIQVRRPPAPTPQPKPKLDDATKRALATAPSKVYILSENIVQYKTAVDVMKKIEGNASFVFVKEYMGGGLNRRRTLVSYNSELDKPRAEVLAAIVRSEGVASVYVEINGSGNDTPGVLQIFFGSDAELEKNRTIASPTPPTVSAFDLKQFNHFADSLKDSNDRVRISGVLGMDKLVKNNGLLRGQTIQHLIPVLRDEEEKLRAIAAVVLQSLGATEAIPFIRQALAETDNQDMKNIIQKRLDQLQKGSK